MKNYAKTNAKILKLSQKSVKWVKFHQFWCNLSFVIHVSSLSGKSWNNGRLWLTQYQVTNTKACHYYGKKTWICWFEDKPITICFTCSSSWKPKKKCKQKIFSFFQDSPVHYHRREAGIRESLLCTLRSIWSDAGAWRSGEIVLLNKFL